MNINENHFTLAQACEILGVPAYRITYLLSTKQVPEPSRLGGRRIFTIQDISRISDLLQIDLATRLHDEDGRRRDG